ncbi:MAG: glycosyltransferase family 4 protein [Methanothrix sp.]|uniref:glycosyltransferase family 4 protein n=1 Tax=Methanothrix sp. TaxID=90426 RepID=UPI0019A99026|nr:glycosyltransferase family 4 protein [Methanothrix sp.]MBC7078968.1 glycosyltransferase family 4 protein [Methanothrix sp.]NPU87127.1 glycosyltransferase family 4 protein [Methanothrix sp.]
MNIWIFNENAYSPDLPGGTRHYDLSRELVRRGHSVSIFATSFHHHMHKEVRLQPGEDWRIEEFEGVRFVWIRTPPYERNDWRRVRNMVAFMFSAWRLGENISRIAPEVGTPDVIIGSSPHLLNPLAAWFVARRFRVPFVMEVRDLWPQTIIDMGVMGPGHPIIKALQVLERFLYHRAVRIITLLPMSHEYITACGVPREKIIWIPNGVDLSRFSRASMKPANHNGFQVMYLGAHGQANALDVLLDAARIIKERGLSEIRFVLIGDGPEKPRLIKMAKELGLENVEFRNPVPKSKVPDVLREADVFLFNLEDVAVFRYGISPNKLFDFMAAGNPVITSVQAPANPVDAAHCGFTIPPRDSKSMAEAIIRLYDMPQDAREEMGSAGRDYVEKHHDIARLAERLEDTLAHILSGP